MKRERSTAAQADARGPQGCPAVSRVHWSRGCHHQRHKAWQAKCPVRVSVSVSALVVPSATPCLSVSGIVQSDGWDG